MPSRPDGVKNAGSAALAALVLVLVVVALRVDVMGADALDYVNNARAMTSRAAILVDKHPPLLGFALAPVAALDWLRVAPATELAVARLYGVGALGVVALATVS